MVTGDDYLAIDANLGKGTSTPFAWGELKQEMVAPHAAMFGEEYLTKLADMEANGFTTAVPEPVSCNLVIVAQIIDGFPRQSWCARHDRVGAA